MKILGAQYSKHTGPDVTNSHKIEFLIDESQEHSMYDFMQQVKKGTEVILLAYITGKDDEEINELAIESEEDTKKRLNRRMHAMINDVAKNKKMKPSDIKKVLKKYLIDKKRIVKSSSELDSKGYAIAIYYLTNEFQL